MITRLVSMFRRDVHNQTQCAPGLRQSVDQITGWLPYLPTRRPMQWIVGEARYGGPTMMPMSQAPLRGTVQHAFVIGFEIGLKYSLKFPDDAFRLFCGLCPTTARPEMSK